MECKVYRLYRGGAPLGDRAFENEPASGRLDYSPRLSHDQIRLTVFTARLRDANGEYVLPPLDSAVVLRIDKDGILLGGAEVSSRTGKRNSRSYHCRQAWLVKPSVGNHVQHL